MNLLSRFFIVFIPITLLWVLLSGASVFLGVVRPSSTMLTDGFETRYTELGTNAICSEPLVGSESIATSGDHSLSPDTSECWGNRSGVQALDLTGTAVSEAVSWGTVKNAIALNNGPNRVPVVNWNTGALAFDANASRACWRYYFQVDATFSNAGGTPLITDARPITGTTRCNFIAQGTGDEPGTNFVYSSATKLVDSSSGANNCDSDNEWTASNRPIRVEGTATGTIVGSITDCTFAAGQTTLTISWQAGSLSNETYDFVGRGCRSCPRNKLTQITYTGGPTSQIEEFAATSCPVAGSHNKLLINNPTTEAPGVDMDFNDCDDSWCRVEMCVSGDLDNGTGGVQLQAQFYSDETKTTYTTPKTSNLSGVTGGPNNMSTIGGDLFHSNGWSNYGTVQGNYTIGMWMEARWDTDNGQFIGKSCEVEGGC